MKHSFTNPSRDVANWFGLPIECTDFMFDYAWSVRGVRTEIHTRFPGWYPSQSVSNREKWDKAMDVVHQIVGQMLEEAAKNAAATS